MTCTSLAPINPPSTHQTATEYMSSDEMPFIGAHRATRYTAVTTPTRLKMPCQAKAKFIPFCIVNRFGPTVISIIN